MASFNWKGRSRSGQLVEGVELADTKDAAVAALRRRNIQVTTIREKGREIPIMKRIKLPLSVPQKRIAIFTRQFSVMLDAGLPLVQCLEILAQQEEHQAFSEMISKVQADIEQGSSLAEAMRKHPKAFNDLYVNMIAAGEAGGILDIILQRLSTYIEKAVKLRSQVKSAMIYPTAVITIAIGVVWVILRFVIPVFAQLFAGVGSELPWLTKMVVQASNFVGNYSIYLFIVLGALIFFILRWHKTERGRRIIDGLLLRMPILGMLLRKIAIARFCRTLATLTSSGVPILDGLEITARTSGNAIIEDAIMAVRKAVEEGKTISEPLGQTNVFPAMVVQMINVGEQTGALDQMLSKIADFYEDEVDTAVAGLMKLIEPLLIVVLGVIIGVIVTAMYLPLYSILTQIA
ncbi:MAG: type II secretion system F family protein [Acidobacteria bacterium]|nr:type II secretion system F family protein [Acidobacteriota bacterium]